MNTQVAGTDTGIVAVRGAEALDLLLSPDLLASWESLYRECPFATVFQSSRFAATWYKTYADFYEALIFYKTSFHKSSDNRMIGLFAVAVDRKTGAIVQCGFPQSEYGVWLARPGDDRDFVAESVAALWKMFPAGKLQLSFAPPNTPINYLGHGAYPLINVVVAPLPRPVHLANAESIKESLSKKSNKSRMNRLLRVGPVEFREFHSADELRPYVLEIASLCDLRQGAVNGALPFRQDPRKSEFFLRLMDDPGVVHAVALTTNGTIAAFHLGFCSPTEEHLGLIAHSPFLAQHSPGKMLLLLLMEQLSKQGIVRFDLTPGGDYKERFQDSHDTAYIIWFFARGIDARLFRARQRLRGIVKRLLVRARFDPVKLLHRIQWLRERVSIVTIVPRAVRVIRKRLLSTEEMRFYAISPRANPFEKFDCGIEFSLNRLEDLLCYEPAERGDRSVRDFLRDCYSRLEAGMSVYTVVESGKLIHYSWLTPRGGNAPSGLGSEVCFPANTYVLWDDYTHPVARGRGLHKHSIRVRASDAIKLGAAAVFINVYASNTPSRRNIENLGFRYFGSVFRKFRLGKARVYSVSDSNEVPGFFL